MGNRLSQIEEYETGELDPALGYFKSIQTDRIQYFYEQLSENRLSEFSLDHPTDSLSWNDYFRLLGEIAEHGRKYTEAEERRSYHPATHDLLLTAIDRAPLPPVPEKGIPDDYTEDESSGDEDEEEESGSEKEKHTDDRRVPSGRNNPLITPNWDPSITNPIFFGVKTSSYQTFLDEREAERTESMAEEKRIVEKTFEYREKALKEFEKQHTGRVSVRQSKIDELVNAYNVADESRMREKERSEETLPAAGLRNFMKKWEKDKKAADKAFQIEVTSMRESHHKKTSEGEEELRLMRIDIDAFKEAESQMTPSAHRLESISREEMERGIADLDRARFQMIHIFVVSLCAICF